MIFDHVGGLQPLDSLELALKTLGHDDPDATLDGPLGVGTKEPCPR